MKAFFIVLIALFSLLQYKLWFGTQGIAQTLEVKSSIQRELKFNQQLADRNTQLATHIKALKTNKNTIESLARQDLGMVKKGETYYQFIS